MTSRHLTIGAAGAVALGLLATSLQAAPLSVAGADLKGAMAAPSSIETVAYRRCWVRQGYRTCQWVGNAYKQYSYNGTAADAARAAASAVPTP